MQFPIQDQPFKVVLILKENDKKNSPNELNVMKTINYKIFCIKAAIVDCLYVVSNSGPVHTYEQREQATITGLIQNISLGETEYE